jgi:hypothetical protein
LVLKKETEGSRICDELGNVSENHCGLSSWVFELQGTQRVPVKKKLKGSRLIATP